MKVTTQGKSLTDYEKAVEAERARLAAARKLHKPVLDFIERHPERFK